MRGIGSTLVFDLTKLCKALLRSASLCLFFITFELQANLRIATWNLEWLSNKKDKVQTQRSHNDYLMLQQISAVLDADLIAFQEVDSVAALMQVLPPSQYQFYLSERALTQKPSKNSQQFTGWAVKKNLAVIDHLDIKALNLPSPSYTSRLRYGAYIELVRHNAPNLHLLSIHLKAGCFNKKPHSSRACKQLNQQITALIVWIKTRILQDQAFIIAGDFNHYMNEKSDWVWKKISQQINKALIVNLTAKTQAACKTRRYNYRQKQWREVTYSRLIDHIIASPSTLTALKLAEAKQFQYPANSVKKYHLSDHCPVFADLKNDDGLD